MATTYVWNEVDDNVEFETDDNGSCVAVYFNQPELFGEPISQTRIGSTSFFQYDGDRSTRALTDENETVTDTFVYSAFGEQLDRTGVTPTPFAYRGGDGFYTNPVIMDIYVRSRTYAPVIGRWLSSISKKSILGSNSYRPDFVNGMNFTSRMDAIDGPLIGRGVLGNTTIPKCEINLDCVNIIGNVGVHCGIEMVYADGKTVRLHNWGLYHPGGKSCLITKRRSPGATDYYQRRLGEFNQSVCNCIADRVSKYNSFIVTYEYQVFPRNTYSCQCDTNPSCNSNYGTHCLLRGCGLEHIWQSGWGAPPTGWNHRMYKCLNAEWVTINHVIGWRQECHCTKWKAVDAKVCEAES